MKNKIIWFLLGVLSTVLVFSIYTFSTSYERNLDKMLYTRIGYKDAHIETALSATAWGYLTHGDLSLYFGELPDKKTAIEINSPSRATIYVYPRNPESMFIRYEPRNGIARNYTLSDYGDFNRYLEVLYEMTDDEVFNETVKYEKN